jgi:hypothetical protein
MIAILMMLLFCVNIEIFLEKPVLPWKTEEVMWTKTVGDSDKSGW